MLRVLDDSLRSLIICIIYVKIHVQIVHIAHEFYPVAAEITGAMIDTVITESML